MEEEKLHEEPSAHHPKTSIHKHVRDLFNSSTSCKSIPGWQQEEELDQEGDVEILWDQGLKGKSSHNSEKGQGSSEQQQRRELGNNRTWSREDLDTREPQALGWAVGR